ncbi:DUF397 domain-containing protein [Yinghuangia soli]|uniref:DUF397 domain-containing protein n=1 Tax=Yinghuangia soli TaxID=2908204 RepID=A0AA41Q1E9_9ACTN|nr:DUF397 domain-containing protein [Yinghuangia soli]MCF2529743.1 DUF397 domain-containing protein [Yinghuangia soli]
MSANKTIWIKSSYSGTDENCVETAAFGAVIGIRDSKEPQVGHIAVAASSWAKLLGGLGR